MMEYKTTLTSNGSRQPIAITIGNFDGVHKGHQRLMRELREMAQMLQATPVLVTFAPHTLMVVRPDIDVHYLTTTEEKLALAREYGHINESIVIHFTSEVAAMSATAFMDNLCKRFMIKGLVIGANFSLGRNRMGDINFLETYGQEHDIQVRAISLTEEGQERISSTRIRTLVSEGSVAEANELLGHPVTMYGIVQHGNKRGRLLGFPTANLLPEAHKLLPANGIYAARVRIQDTAASDATLNSTVYKGAASIGVNPTFNGTERRVEVYLLDVTLDLYNTYLTTEFIARLRDEQRFSSIEALKAQMAIDVQQVRHILQY